MGIEQCITMLKKEKIKIKGRGPFLGLKFLIIWSKNIQKDWWLYKLDIIFPNFRMISMLRKLYKL